MEVVVLEVFEMRAGVGCREQQATQVSEWFHRAADIHQQEHLDSILTAALPEKLTHTGVLGGGVNGLLDVKFVLNADARELAQSPESQLNLAYVEDKVTAVVTKMSLLGNLNGVPAL